MSDSPTTAPEPTQEVPPQFPLQEPHVPLAAAAPNPQDQYDDETEGPESEFDSQERYLPEEDYRPQAEQLLIEWQAPSRPFKKRNRQYFTTIAIIVLLISLILFFAGQFLPIAVVISVAFLAYVLSAVPPDIATYRVTTYGIHIDKVIYYWEEMGRFWFTEKYKQRLLHIELARFPNQLTLVLGTQDEVELVELLSEVLAQEQPLPTAFDKAATWLQEKIPLDTDA